MRLSLGVPCALLISASIASAAGFLDRLFRHDTRVMTNTDVLAAGKSLTPPTPQHPVYYCAISAGFRDFGPPKGGEKVPPDEQMVKAITKTLAQQGYQLATNKNPPTIVIIYSWGTLNADRFQMFDPQLPSPVMNRGQILSFLGAYKFSGYSEPPKIDDSFYTAGLTSVSPDSRNLVALSDDDFYVIALAAYEFPNEKVTKPQKLWQTRVSCPSLGHMLPEVLPVMLSIAGPHVGRATDKPVWVNATDHFKPNIELGPSREVDESGKPVDSH